MEQKTSLKNKLILIIDDDKDVQEVIAEELIYNGYNNLLFASNGKQALEIIKAKKIDLILSDLQMPQMGGLELYNSLKDIEERPHFLLITGSDLHDLEEAPDESLNLIQKPFDFEHLIAYIGGLDN